MGEIKTFIINEESVGQKRRKKQETMIDQENTEIQLFILHDRLLHRKDTDTNICRHTYTDRQTDIGTRTNKQTHRQTYEHRLTDRYTDRHTDKSRETNKLTHRQIYEHRQTDRQKYRDRHSEISKQYMHAE